MPRSRLRLALLITLPLLALGGVAAYYAALHLLREQVVAALGSTGEVGEITVSLNEVRIDGLRIKASRPGWPAAEELRAERVSVTPDLRSLLGGKVVVSKIRIENAALSVLRSKAGVKILPALLDPPGKEAPQARKKEASGERAGIPIHIGTVELQDSRVDFYDATIASPSRPYHIALDQLALRVDNLDLPALDTRAALTLKARAASQGQLGVEGWLVPATMESDLKLSLAGLPVKTLEPYLFKGKAGEVKAGKADLNLHAKVHQRKLSAPGHLSLQQLDLGGLAGFTREAVAAVARAKGLDADTRRPVNLDFTLQGNLDDARFSLNDAIYAQAGLASLQLLGLNVGQGGSSNSSGGGLGSMLKGLFGK